MRIFVSAGEPSGDLHGSNLIRALSQLDPAIEAVGFGGERMTRAVASVLSALPPRRLGFVPVLADAIDS